MPEEENVLPNSKQKEFENARRNSIADAVKAAKGDRKSDEPEKSEENSKKSEEKLDNNQKNSYIDNKNDNSSEDDASDEKSNQEQVDEYERILEETFGGDPKKAVKSWKESSKNFTKLRNKSKEQEKKLNAINSLVEENPLVADILEATAKKGNLTEEDLQSFLSEDDREPKGKPNKSSSKSKLEIVDDEFDVSDIDESTLAESGYLDPDKKQSMSPSEWSVLKRQAAIRYAEDELPKKLANKAYQQFQQQIDKAEKQKKEEKQRQKNQEIIADRYEQGIERVVDEFNLDFAGNSQHEEMLDEIEALASNIRDPQNKDVIHPNAIYLATVEVLRDKGINPGKATNVDEEVEKAEQEANEAFDDKTGFNTKTKPSGNDEPETLADKLKQRHASQYQKTRQKRIDTGRLNPDE